MAIVKRLRASAVCEAEGHLLVVRLRDPVSGVVALYPPGGGVEPDEEPAATARRETLEETGLHVRVDERVRVVDTYPFHWAGIDYDVTTHYLAASLEGPFDPVLPAVVDAEYNLGAAWLQVDEALDAMAIHPAIAASVARVLRLAKRSAWQKHPNAGGPAATLLAIHDQFRLASERLTSILEREDAPSRARVMRAFEPLARMLHHHHQAEQAMLFPLVERRTNVAPTSLTADHEALTRAIEEVENSLATGADLARLATALAAFTRVLGAHLDREEALVVPLLLMLTPDEAAAMCPADSAFMKK